MINAIPVAGWFLSLFFSISLAVPFWFVWTVCGIGDSYFYFLPPVWRSPGFWACVGIFIAVSIIKAVFVPRLFSIDNSAKAGGD
jgi:hypothetical protein